ncbi:MAG: nickel-responsive transcriptional regulator NikR [Candidatus Eisenbacteria bacterium]
MIKKTGQTKRKRKANVKGAATRTTPAAKNAAAARPEPVVRFTVSLPASLFHRMHGGVVARGYSSRSEYIRDLVREQLVQEKWMGADEDVVGVLTICYDHHQRELPDRIMQVQHRSFVHILCNTHIHLDEHDCVEAIFLRGKPADIEKVSLELAGLRGVKLAKLTRAGKVTT